MFLDKFAWRTGLYAAHRASDVKLELMLIGKPGVVIAPDENRCALFNRGA